MIHIAIVDDHTIFREGLRLLMTTISDIDVIGEAQNGIEFLELMEKQIPDVVLMDINMPKMDGIDATRAAIEKYPEINILILSMYGDEIYLEKAMEAGVKGFIKKNANIEEMENAIRTIHQGRSYYASDIVEMLAILYKNRNINSIDKEKKIVLSSREIEVLEGICEGLSNHEIGEKLFISPRTVDGHRANLLSKSGCKNTASLVMWSIKNGYVTLT